MVAVIENEYGFSYSRDAWKCIATLNGEQSVMTGLRSNQLKLRAEAWASRKLFCDFRCMLVNARYYYK